MYGGGNDLKSETDIAKDEVKWGKNDLADQVQVQVRKCGTNATKYVPRIEGHGDMPMQKYFWVKVDDENNHSLTFHLVGTYLGMDRMKTLILMPVKWAMVKILLHSKVHLY